MKLYTSGIGSRLQTEKFILTRSLLVITVSMLSNVFAYLFQILSGRYFSIGDYASLVSLFNLSGIMLIIITIFTGGITKLVAEIKDIDYPTRISKLFLSLVIFHTIFSVIFFALMILFTPAIQNYLKIYDSNLIFAFAVAILAGNLIGFFPLMLQGLLRFKAYSFVNFLSAFTKFLTILLVIYTGSKVIDVFWGLSIMTIVTGITAFLLLKKNIRIKKYSFDFVDFKKLINYSLFSSLGLIGVNVMQNLDMVLVKHNFDEISAGIYGSTTIIGRIVFFAASPVAIVMLPICAEKYKKGQDFIKPFLISVFISFFIALSISTAYMVAPKLIIHTLFGTKYENAIEYLGIYGMYMVTYTVLNLLTVFFISISKFKYASLAIIAPIIEYIGLLYFNDSIPTVIFVNATACIVGIVALAYSFTKVLKEQKFKNGN